MVSKEEFKVLEDKHDKLQKQVDKMMKDLVERLEKMIKAVQDQVDVLADRVNNVEDEINGLNDSIEGVKAEVQAAKDRLNPLEEIMPTKADRTELEAAIQEIKDEMDKLNIEEIMAMAEKANERLDVMDERCDGIEDDLREFKEYVLRKEQEMEDLQLEKQIEQLRRELEEAKQGVFQKAQMRMDAMQAEMDSQKNALSDSQGTIQVNREAITELEEALREAGASLRTKKTDTTKVLLAQLQQDMADLQKRYAEAAAKEAAGQEQAEKTETLVSEIRAKMLEIESAKADWNIVDAALRVKADKDAVARDTEANQRAVDMALSTMNAGTQGIQQMLEKQEESVGELSTRLSNKLDKNDLERLEAQLAQTQSQTASTGNEMSLEQAEAMYGAYGISAEDAALMVRGGRFKPGNQNPIPSLPLLPGSKNSTMTTTVAYVPSARSPPPVWGTASTAGDSIVEVTDIGSSLRSAGGGYTSSRKTSSGMDGRPVRVRSATVRGSGDASSKRSTQVIGDNGQIYQGRPLQRPKTTAGRVARGNI